MSLISPKPEWVVTMMTVSSGSMVSWPRGKMILPPRLMQAISKLSLSLRFIIGTPMTGASAPMRNSIASTRLSKMW